VLPAATWGEKLGTFTNTDRTVHLSEQAVEPPGSARSDLDIFLDYARRMAFKDKDGQPLVTWDDPESAFENWKRCSAGRPCDYSGLSYQRLRDAESGIQWPCTADEPDGTERLYVGGGFWATSEECETFGRDMVTGASMEKVEYQAFNPLGKAMFKAATFVPLHQDTTDEYPFQLTTGRTIYHFHTRTKTARAPELQAAAPDVWVEMCATDAQRLGARDGDLLEIESPSGRITGTLRLADVRRGTVFVPFHYGYWDGDSAADADDGPVRRAANELTVTDWDPVSKQPLFKLSIARVRKWASRSGP
jgi:anaerobic selenocysteine-containing dehydrogenase